MSWMKHNKLAKTIAASIAAVGICFGATAVASAVCRYPVTSAHIAKALIMLNGVCNRQVHM